MAKAKDIKDYLNSHGIETRNIRVSSGSSIHVKLLDPKLNYEQIDNLLKEKYENYQRDEASGEILSGGNTFVFVEYDYDTIAELAQNLRGTVVPFLQKCSGPWSIHNLTKHYVETQQFEEDPRAVKRAISEALYSVLREDPNQIPGLVIENW